VTTAAQPLDPWLSMWVRPRATIRQVLDTNPDSQIILLAVLSGIITTFGRAAGRSLGDQLPFPAVIVVCLALGSVGGVIGLYVGAAVLAWMGRMLGGRGQARDVRAALAWAAIPTIWGGILLVPELILFREELFTTETPRLSATPLLTALLLIFGVIEVVIGIWSFVVFLKSLGEAHGFSAWRALGTATLSTLLVAAPVLCLIVALGVLTLLGTRVSG
jgi:hypothetical protein